MKNTKNFPKTSQQLKYNSLFEYYGFTQKEAKQYPIITNILKQLTPQRIQKEIETIQNIKLPLQLQKWVKEYEKVGYRNDFIWKWVYEASKIITFPTVSLNYQKKVWEIKTLIFICDTFLDDIADKDKDKKLIDSLIKIPFERENHINKKNKFKNLLKFREKLIFAENLFSCFCIYF